MDVDAEGERRQRAVGHGARSHQRRGIVDGHVSQTGRVRLGLLRHLAPGEAGLAVAVEVVVPAFAVVALIEALGRVGEHALEARSQRGTLGGARGARWTVATVGTIGTRRTRPPIGQRLRPRQAILALAGRAGPRRKVGDHAR